MAHLPGEVEDEGLTTDGGRTWQNLPEFSGKLVSEYAVKVYGSGHVVAYNYIANFHDGVDVATYGNPDGSPNPIRDRMPVSIDFYNNDISNVEDNCIESDGGAHNIRILRNRCFNHGHRALSVQPMFGGPVYFIRNIVYHAPEGGAVAFSVRNSVAVNVRPRLRLTHAGSAHRFLIRALAVRSLVGKYGVLQRWNRRAQVWVSVRRVYFRSAIAGISPTMVSRATFRAHFGRVCVAAHSVCSMSRTTC